MLCHGRPKVKRSARAGQLPHRITPRPRPSVGPVGGRAPEGDTPHKAPPGSPHRCCSGHGPDGELQAAARSRTARTATRPASRVARRRRSHARDGSLPGALRHRSPRDQPATLAARHTRQHGGQLLTLEPLVRTSTSAANSKLFPLSVAQGSTRVRIPRTRTRPPARKRARIPVRCPTVNRSPCVSIIPLLIRLTSGMQLYNRSLASYRTDPDRQPNPGTTRPTPQTSLPGRSGAFSHGHQADGLPRSVAGTPRRSASATARIDGGSNVVTGASAAAVRLGTPFGQLLVSGHGSASVRASADGGSGSATARRARLTRRSQDSAAKPAHVFGEPSRQPMATDHQRTAAAHPGIVQPVP